MIRRVYANHPGFKDLAFKEGFNVLLSERSAGATDKQTRNRVGKSSLLDLIHFLLGSSCDKDSIFRNAALNETTFGMEFDLGGAFTRVERSGARPTPLTVFGDTAKWPVAPSSKGEGFVLSNDNWKVVLGKLMFGLDESADGAYGPSFRSLLPYFVRRDREGGMQHPMSQGKKQQLVNQQVNVSFLVGLDWSIAREWQNVREREKSVDQLRKGMREGVFGSIIGTASALKSELIVGLDRVKKLRASVGSFRVLEQYHDLEREASSLTARLAELSNANVIDHRYLGELEATTVEEVPPPPGDLDRLYKEAGVLLPDLIRKRFDDVRDFHESVVRNRRAYLHDELAATKSRIAERDGEKSKLDTRRAEVMSVLKSAGALEQLMALQGELSRAEADHLAVTQKHQTAVALESGELKLKVERALLVERLRQDYTEQEKVIEEAVLTFRAISSQLYEDQQAGSLTITPTENGPIYDPHMPGEKSKGVNNMRIFCFDMMLMMLSIRRGRSPGFLVHDSHLFDGVDGRQVGRALAVGARLSKQASFQYIVTMNTDAIPREVPAGFSIEAHALPVRLTDASEDGGLFGVRFD